MNRPLAETNTEYNSPPSEELLAETEKGIELRGDLLRELEKFRAEVTQHIAVASGYSESVAAREEIGLDKPGARTISSVEKDRKYLEKKFERATNAITALGGAATGDSKPKK